MRHLRQAPHIHFNNIHPRLNLDLIEHHGKPVGHTGIVYQHPDVQPLNLLPQPPETICRVVGCQVEDDGLDLGGRVFLKEST